MPSDMCGHHVQLSNDLAVIKNDLEYMRNRVTQHVDEGEREGGYRDQMLIMKRDIDDLKKRFWISSAVGGLIGAVVGSGSNDVIVMFIKWIVGSK